MNADFQSARYANIDSVVVIAREHWRLIVAVLALAVVTTTIIAYILTPVYKADIYVIAVDDSQSMSGVAALARQFGGISGFPGQNFAGVAKKDQAIAVLKSRLFTIDFIQSVNGLQVLFPDLWDKQSQAWRNGAGNGPPTNWQVYERFNEDVRFVTEDSKTGVIKVSIALPDREIAAHWANILVRKANDVIRQKDIAEAEKSLQFLQDELLKTSVVDLKQVIYGLIETQISKIMMANVREEYAFRVIDPAVRPDLDKFAWPKRRLMIGASILFGFLAGLLAAIIKHSFTTNA